MNFSEHTLEKNNGGCMAITSYMGLMGAGMSHQYILKNYNIGGFMDGKRKIAYLINMRDELVQKGMEMREILKQVETPAVNVHVLLNKYMALIEAVNKEIARQRVVEDIVENWNR